MTRLKSLIGSLLVIETVPISEHLDGRGYANLLIQGVQNPPCLKKWALVDWDVLLRLAKSSNLIGRLALAAQQEDVWSTVPVPVQPHLLSALALVTHQRSAVQWEARHIQNALGGLQFPVVLLKGAAYALTDLSAAQGRLFGDVDVLVPREHMAEAESQLMMHGWSSGSVDPYDERYYRQWMHEIPPMTHRMRGTVIDLHHNVLPLTAKWVPAAALFLADSQPVVGSLLRVLSPEDRVIHSATHLFHEGELKNGLRDLFDLDALLREGLEADSAFAERVLARARQHNLVWPVQLCFRYSRYFLNTPISDEVHAQAGRSPGAVTWGLPLMDWVYHRVLMPDHPICHSGSVFIARTWIYLRSHVLRMPLGKLAVHLARKAFMRLYKNTSRSD